MNHPTPWALRHPRLTVTASFLTPIRIKLPKVTMVAHTPNGTTIGTLTYQPIGHIHNGKLSIRTKTNRKRPTPGGVPIAHP